MGWEMLYRIDWILVSDSEWKISKRFPFNVEKCLLWTEDISFLICETISVYSRNPLIHGIPMLNHFLCWYLFLIKKEQTLHSQSSASAQNRLHIPLTNPRLNRSRIYCTFLSSTIYLSLSQNINSFSITHIQTCAPHTTAPSPQPTAKTTVDNLPDPSHKQNLGNQSRKKERKKKKSWLRQVK